MADGSIGTRAPKAALLLNLKPAMGGFDTAALALHYQPIVDLRSAEVTSAEALLRDGEATPSAEIADAENGDAIFELDRWILRGACRDAAAWREAGLDNIAVHVNLSALELGRTELPSLIDEAIAAAGIPPSSLQIEITETKAIGDPKLARRLLESISGRGVGVWLDDFGTGHSSLMSLKDFRIDGLKLPYELIHGVPEGERCASIVRRLIDLAHDLGAAVIAEGVERDAEVDFLRACGCDAIQGYFLAEAVTAHELLAEVGRRRTGRE